MNNNYNLQGGPAHPFQLPNCYKKQITLTFVIRFVVRIIHGDFVR